MKYNLADIMDIIGGGTPKTNVEEYWDGEIPWLSVKDFNNDNRYVYRAEKTITKLGLENSSTKLLRYDDIIISARGTVGEVAMIPYPMAFNQSCYGLRAKDEIVDSTYLYYLIRYNIRELRRKSHGSVFDTITKDTFTNIEIDLPNMTIQRKVAIILKEIDDKIECNHAINKNLEEQARAIFDSFYLKSKNKVPFTQMIKILGGGTPKTTERAFWCGQIPFFTPKDVGNPYVLQTEKYVTELGLTNCNSRLYPVNTTFVTARGTVGKVSLAGIPMAMNQSCYALMSDALHPFMTYFYTLHTVKALQHKATGAVFDAIVTSDFESELLHRIPENDASQLLSRISPMMENIRVNTVGNLRLTELRDALLPRLMSGEIDVSDIAL